MHDSVPAAPTQAQRLLLFTRREYCDALEQLIGLARQELRMLDGDCSGLDMNSPRKYELLRAFMLRSPSNRLHIAVHDATYIRNDCPRLLTLLRHFSERLFIHQTQGEAATAQDSFVLADRLHCVRHAVQAQPRATLRINDSEASQAIYLRFSEIWDSSFPAVSATTSGL